MSDHLSELDSRGESSKQGLRQNVELKARLRDLDFAREIAEKIATERADPQRQVDTYFECREGRLKLREINSNVAQLIGYRRPDENDPKVSDYCLIEVTQPAAVKRALSAALGIHVVVEKNREIYFYENVRIHLDRVSDLGEFLEFEAVLSPEDDETAGREKISLLQEKFQIAKADLLAESYADMLLVQNHKTT